MGKNNRQRRAAKKKKRKKQQTGHRQAQDFNYDSYDPFDLPDNDLRGPSTPELVATLAEQAAESLRNKDTDSYKKQVESFARKLKPSQAAPTLENIFLQCAALLWSNGWQPTELCRRVTNQQNALCGRLIKSTILADHCDRPSETMHPNWSAQLEELGFTQNATKHGWLKKFIRNESLDWASATDAILRTFTSIYFISPLTQLIPPPGEYSPNTKDAIDPNANISDPILKKVRALLIKAEATDFGAEAEAFTAKAHELMARHSIDRTLLAQDSEKSDRPVAIRLQIDNPYAEQKSLLLHVLAESYRCRSIFDPTNLFSTLVGSQADLTAIEILFTSLLVQVQTAIRNEAKKAPPGSQRRSRRFKTSFFLGFTDRISDRLEEINTAVMRQTEGDMQNNILPVLSKHSDSVNEVVDELFGDSLRAGNAKAAYDKLGYASGEIAANQVDLNAGLTEK